MSATEEQRLADTDPQRRTHPLTPLTSGWKLLTGLLALIVFRHLDELTQEFTWQRALYALALVAGALVLTIGVSALSWWRTTYAITPAGVVLSHGILTRTRRTAPREKIESVSVERPVLARLLGLARVRIEVAGGDDSHLDLAFVTSADAERIRTELLRLAEAPDGAPEADAPADGSASAPHGLRERVRAVALDGVTDGMLLAEIPTSRLLQSLLRDARFMIGLAAALVWTVVAIILGITRDGFGIASLVALAPVVLALPQMVMGRIEAGWGFVSRLTPTGLRMRRGLMTTRTDNLAAGRIQLLRLNRSLLWRTPDWTSVTPTVAGIGDSDENDSTSALPVGTREELGRTLGALIPPLGTDDDLAAVGHLLAAPARQIDGIRPVHPLFWFRRCTCAAVLLPAAVVLRSGVLTRRLTVIPRDRIQGVRLSQGPVTRRTGAGDLLIAVAGTSDGVLRAPISQLSELRDTLTVDACRGRRYAERDSWAMPVLEKSAR